MNSSTQQERRKFSSAALVVIFPQALRKVAVTATSKRSDRDEDPLSASLRDLAVASEHRERQEGTCCYHLGGGGQPPNAPS